MIVVGTGHRPEKITDRDWLLENIGYVYDLAGAEKVIQGCAAGADLLFAYAAHSMGIPYVAAKPWENHKSRMGGSSGFKHDDAVVYDLMIKHASEIVNVTGAVEYPGPWAYFKRNEWMVDQITPETGIVLAAWDGTKSGTQATVTYALDKGIRVFQLDPLNNKVVGWIE
ncbi:DprA-like ssDNA binding protein [Streptomyces phage BillNye]|uniref:DprA-like ssDNA binding protein n=1 Tax=Streptomyces phage BillNye TaxID=2079426 RepID=A0A2L1IVR4_9CAUD|nr:GTP-binding domain [Streptomyces phage BillNye]AVD99271.1 DprA-like ssDNA binding protein [Streptomyces phage BillNye]